MTTVQQGLNDVWAKIERADEHIQALSSEVNAVINDSTYRLFSKASDDATKCSIYVIGPEPPLRFSTILGDAVHQLRSSLNLLVCKLVIKGGNEVTKQHQFPICDSLRNFQGAINQGQLKGISAHAERTIEAMQPFKTVEDFESNFLYVLRELDNADKHRSLIVAKASADVNSLRIEADRNVTIQGLSPPKGPQRPTLTGIELYEFTFGEPQPGIKIHGEPIVNILFGDSGVMPEQPVVNVISQLKEKTVSLINIFQESEF